MAPARHPPGDGDALKESSRRPWIVAHRGAGREAPENTRAAFDAALAHGVAGLEFDVQLSRDGVPVIYHDRTLARIGVEVMGSEWRRCHDVPWRVFKSDFRVC